MQRLQKSIILLGRADTDPEILTQHRIAADVTNQDVALQQIRENPCWISGRFHRYKISSRSYRRKPVDLRQLREHTFTLRDDLANQWTEFAFIVFNGHFGGHLR